MHFLTINMDTLGYKMIINDSLEFRYKQVVIPKSKRKRIRKKYSNNHKNYILNDNIVQFRDILIMSTANYNKILKKGLIC